jgi:hypothetical protein
MGSLLSSLAAWRPTPGAGTYTVLGDTSGFFERYLTLPSSSSAAASPSLAQLPALLAAQLAPAAGARGAEEGAGPRHSQHSLPTRTPGGCCTLGSYSTKAVLEAAIP